MSFNLIFYYTNKKIEHREKAYPSQGEGGSVLEFLNFLLTYLVFILSTCLVILLFISS